MAETKNYSQDGLAFIANKKPAVPGQSLTSNPETPRPFEQAPKYVELQPALDTLFIQLTEPEAYRAIVDLIDDGNTISDVAQIILTMGFQDGLWNPDLMMILIEPTMYLIMSLVEKAGRLEYTIVRDDEDDANDSEPEQEDISQLEKILVTAKNKATKNSKSVKMPSTLAEKLDDLEVPKSLLEKPEEEVQE